MKIEEMDPPIDAALREDMPSGDITSESVVPPDSRSRAVICAKEAGVLAGIGVAGRVFLKIDGHVHFNPLFPDGSSLASGDILAEIEGNSISLLKGERTALNFLQRMSGIATMTRRFTQSLSGTKTKILDTRKTTPGLRYFEKYAVRVGGGENHRFSLSDMVLIKDNHLRLAGSITEAVARVKAKVPEDIRIEVETTDLEEVKEALEAGVHMIMLDNMSIDRIKEAVTWMNGRVPLEISGNVDLEKAKKLADIGVDYISVGSLTHSYRSLDISMNFM